MELKTISRWFVITGALIIWSVKFGIRPFTQLEEPAKFILGIAPNLLGSFLIPFGAYWFFNDRYHLLARIFRIQSLFDLRFVCLLGFGMLVINEYFQLFSVFGRTFDYYDIFSSAIGLSVSYLVFGKILIRYQLQSN
jgi:hypothetical protein